MSYVRHNTVVVTAAGHAMRGAGAPDVDAFRRSLPEEWRHLVVGPVGSAVEDYQSFVFLPDGSKEGWPESDLGDEYRERFIGLFSFAHEEDWSTPFDVVIVTARFGGDEPGTDLEPELVVTANPHVPASGRPGSTVVVAQPLPGP